MWETEKGAYLPSNDGRNLLGIKPDRSWQTSKGQEVLLAEVSLTGKFWQRDLLIENAIGGADLVDDYLLRLPQLILSMSSLGEFRDKLQRWLVEPFELESGELSAQHFPSFSILFGIREDLVCDIGKPACTILYSGEGMPTGEWAFVVDWSCIDILSKGLDSISSYTQ